MRFKKKQIFLLGKSVALPVFVGVSECSGGLALAAAIAATGSRHASVVISNDIASKRNH